MSAFGWMHCHINTQEDVLLALGRVLAAINATVTALPVYMSSLDGLISSRRFEGFYHSDRVRMVIVRKNVFNSN